jgi:hypothetical protein
LHASNVPIVRVYPEIVEILVKRTSLLLEGKRRNPQGYEILNCDFKYTSDPVRRRIAEDRIKSKFEKAF